MSSGGTAPKLAGVLLRSDDDGPAVAEKRLPDLTAACPCELEALSDLVDDLTAEHAALLRLLEGLAPADWKAPSSCQGWTVSDCVAHLAHTSEVAADTCLGGPLAFRSVVPAFRDADAFVQSGLDRGRDLAPTELLAWWANAARRERQAIGRQPPNTKVRWGFGMSAEMFARARLMEAWAHGHDVASGVGAETTDGWRLRHICSLAVHSLRYAYRRARQTPLDGELRVVVSAPDGRQWQHGPAGAAGQITGSLAELARVAVRRLPAHQARTIRAEGTGCHAVLVICAYL